MAMMVPKPAARSEARIGRVAVFSSATIRFEDDSPKMKRKLSRVGSRGIQVSASPEACHSGIGLKAIEAIQKGGLIVAVGVYGDRPRVNMGLVQDRELRLIGTLMYQEEDYREAIRLAAEGRVHLAPLISGHFAFRDYRKAYEAIASGGDRVLKALIDVT